MKKTLVSLMAALLCFAGYSQTNAPPPETSTNQPPMLPEVPGIILGFLSNTASNWYVAPYGIYCNDTKSFGAGIGVGYALSPYVLTVLRMDYINNDIWLPSGSVQIQAPIMLMNRVRATPFAFGGLATPISGRGEDNTTAVGIAGTGIGVRWTDHWGLLYDIEYWSNFSGPQHRFGVYWKF